MTKLNLRENILSEAIRLALVADGEDITSAGLVRAEGNADEQLVVLLLTTGDCRTMEVSFYVYFDGSWYSTYDWQGWQPKRKDEVPDAEWQLGVTGRKAVILDGAPRMLTEIEKPTLTRDEEREYNKIADEAMRQSKEDGLCRMVVMTPEDRKFVVLTEKRNNE